HLLLLVSAVPPPGVWSLRSRGPAAPRPLCTRRSPSAPRPICIWDRTSLIERDSRSALPRQRALPPRAPLGYTFVSPHGMATAQPNSHSLLHNAGLNLRETPATLRPFLFGPRGEGVDPQLYVTITISIIIVLVATGIIFKFCWDRNQKRRRHSGQQSGGRQQESQQPLTDLSPTTVSILGPYGDSLAPTPEAQETRQGQEGVEKLGGHGKSTAFQLNR
ncbi:PILR alpha-associated neural protein, partial [Chlamydotis macqueenii]